MIRLPSLGLLAVIAVLCIPAVSQAQDKPDAERGKYLVMATGGCGCHTDYKHKGDYLAGGRSIKTPFGLAFGSNIPPDRETGLGEWTEDDFVKAMTQGVGLHGKELFPVFPYTSFTRMEPKDLRDIWAYLGTVKPVKLARKDPDFLPPFNIRLGVKGWKLVNFTPGTFQPNTSESPTWNRGAYIANALAHCAECHTPRN